MRRPLRLFASLALAAVAVSLYAHPLAPQEGPPKGRASASQDIVKPALDRYCITCHNEKAKTAGLALDLLRMLGAQE